MPIYTDKKNNTLFVKFDYQGYSYKKRLPRSITKREAKEFEANWKAELFRSRFGVIDKPQITFEDFLVEYFLPHSEAGKKSFKRDLYVCKIALKFFKGKNMRDIRPADVEKFKTKRCQTLTVKGTIRKPATVEREFAVVSKIFSMAMANEFVDSNPCRKVASLKFDNTQIRKLYEDDDERFFASFDSDWARDICKIILNTALRLSDAFGLEREDIDWENECINTLQGKTKRRVIIPMNETVKTIIKSYIGSHTNQLVFPSPRTGKKGVTVKTAMTTAINRSGIPYISVRDLRRTAATRMLEAGVNHITIAAILGHTDLRMVQRYAQPSNALRDAVKTLESKNRAKIVPLDKNDLQAVPVSR